VLLVSFSDLTKNTPTEALAGDNVRRLRQSQALELQELAKLTGMSAERLGGIEAGQPGVLCLDDLDQLASALAVSPATLFLSPEDEAESTDIKL
jgi:transcriptional regulator with XRE-family HTH domain